MIDQYCARFHRGNSASSCRGHAAYIIVITYASEYHIGVLDTFCYRFSILPAKLFRPRHNKADSHLVLLMIFVFIPK
ncbi:Uncharacterised protein [Vibrio cholerae]|nr:Uncharacterised protein [Vibrio cholerae]